MSQIGDIRGKMPPFPFNSPDSSIGTTFVTIEDTMNRTYALLFVLFTACVLAQPGKTSWKAELSDDVKGLQPVQNGKYLFLTSDENAWLYENATGKKVWSVKVRDYSKKAIHTLINDSLYVVANGDSLFCYSVLSDTVLWKRMYKGIEQDQFRSFSVNDTLLLITYKKTDLAVSLVSGKEAWRSAIVYNADLKEQGTVNQILLPKQRKGFAFNDDDACLLFSLDSGKTLLTIAKSVPHPDLVEQHRAWHYVTTDEKYAVILFKKNVVVVELDSNKVLLQHPVDLSDDFNALYPADGGCAVLQDESLLYIDFATKTVSSIAGDADDLRAIVYAPTDSGTVLVASWKNAMSGTLLRTGKKLWQSAPKDKNFSGFLREAVASDSNNIVATYLDDDDDLMLYVASINALTGKMNYRTLVAHADESLPKRELPLPAVSAVSEKTIPSFGYENAGFNYSVKSENGIVQVLVHTASDMIEPNSKNKGGEGIILVDAESGAVTAKHVMKIAQGLDFRGGLSALAKPLTVGILLILPGEEKLVALDATSGMLKWMLVEQDLNGGYVFETAMVDTILYVRTGGARYTFQYDPKKNKLSEKRVWENDVYTILAVDTTDGKVYWKKEFDQDPGRLFLDYSVGSYHSDSGLVFVGSPKFLTALDMAKKGAVRWNFEFSDSGTGKYSYEDLHRLSTIWSGEVTTIDDSVGTLGNDTVLVHTVPAVSGTMNTIVSKNLFIAYSKPLNRIVVVGDDGIAGVDPQKGKRVWIHEWSYDEKAVQHRPVVLKDNLFYAVDGKAALINIVTGKMVWQAKIGKSQAIYIMPDRSSIVTVDEDVVNGFIVP